jgi:hypothetical protein
MGLSVTHSTVSCALSSLLFKALLSRTMEAFETGNDEPIHKMRKAPNTSTPATVNAIASSSTLHGPDEDKQQRKAAKARRKEERAERRAGCVNRSHNITESNGALQPEAPLPSSSTKRKRGKDTTTNAEASSSANSQSIIKSTGQIATSTAGTRKEGKQSDAELRRLFAQPGAMNAWLAEQWRTAPELNRLQQAGSTSRATPHGMTD